MTQALYKGKTRIRACGVLLRGNKILLIQLRSPVSERHIWTPPGGGVEFGEPLRIAVAREFKEETSLIVRAEKLIYINELLTGEFHALEFYFSVSMVDGKLALGKDPEHSDLKQILNNIDYFSKAELKDMNVVPGFFKDEFWHIHENGSGSVITNWAS